MENIMEPFGKRLKELRKREHKTQVEMAKMLECTDRHYQRMEYGYVKKRRAGDKAPKITSRPFHYRSSDGYDIYVGKNNYQNEELTFKLASGNDWWFHAKGIPGSHVILKVQGQDEVPDRAFEEAGALAAYYSKGRDNDKVEVDYIQKKHIKKPKI